MEFVGNTTCLSGDSMSAYRILGPPWGAERPPHRDHLCHVTHWRLCHTAMHAPNQCQVCPTARAAINLFHNAKSAMRSEDGICGQRDMPNSDARAQPMPSLPHSPGSA